jgi:hypothetical protein
LAETGKWQIRIVGRDRKKADQDGWQRQEKRQTKMVGRDWKMPDQDGWQTETYSRPGWFADRDICQTRMVGRDWKNSR